LPAVPGFLIFVSSEAIIVHWQGQWGSDNPK